MGLAHSINQKVLDKLWDTENMSEFRQFPVQREPLQFLRHHVQIQYKCLVPIYVSPEIKQRGLVISKTEL